MVKIAGIRAEQNAASSYERSNSLSIDNEEEYRLEKTDEPKYESVKAQELARKKLVSKIIVDFFQSGDKKNKEGYLESKNFGLANIYAGPKVTTIPTSRKAEKTHYFNRSLNPRETTLQRPRTRPTR